MVDPSQLLAERLQTAFDLIEPGADPVLRDSDRADFQANGALPLSKRLGRPGPEVARQIVESARLDDVCQSVEVSGPGFINLVLATPFVAERLAEMAGDERLGVAVVARPERIVVDYSAPNVAKEMHVGHLRSTVIGDALRRMLEFVGHHVIAENHIGDWGTPFGMLIEHLVDLGQDGVEAFSVGDLNEFYRQARQTFDADETFRERSRRRVVLLQSGDPETMALWNALVAESIRHYDAVYEKLGVELTDDEIVGESFYNPMLAGVVEDLRALGLLVQDDGAQCVFPPGFTNRQGEPLPLIVQKSDEGYGYAATDLAAVRDRVGRLRADRMLYVVGTTQAQHLEMIFAAATLAGWLPETVQAVHVGFGNVLGQDKKMLKSRAGEAVKLDALLDEAVERAEAALATRQNEMVAADRSAVARDLGIGAVKYADLSTERQRDYVFDWERMLASEGNTGPYLQYAHARICSIFRRTGAAVPGPGTTVVLDHPHERALGLALLRFTGAIETSLVSYSPSKLCAYLFDLASVFTSFYENCPVLRAPDEATRDSRLLLSSLTARTLALGLSLLGIHSPQQM